MSENMCRILILVTNEQFMWLKNKSNAEDTPVTGLIRQLISAEMDKVTLPHGDHA